MDNCSKDDEQSLGSLSLLKQDNQWSKTVNSSKYGVNKEEKF